MRDLTPSYPEGLRDFICSFTCLMASTPFVPEVGRLCSRQYVRMALKCFSVLFMLIKFVVKPLFYCLEEFSIPFVPLM